MKPGDVVYLKSGGPDMTLDSIVDNTCKCVWFKADKLMETFFPKNFLVVSGDLLKANNEESEEKWRTIPDFQNYVISNKGRVANKNGTIKKISANGYVKLSSNGFFSIRSLNALMKKIW